MSYAVKIVQPDYYPHWACMSELADGLRGGLEELGAYDPHGRQITLCAHMLPYHYESLPADAIVYNTEVVGVVDWFTPKYLALLASHEVWDYSIENVKALARKSIKAKHCQIGYHECLTRITRTYETQLDGTEKTAVTWNAVEDIDVLFYGSMTPRREEIWRDICSTGLNCVQLFGVYGEARDAYIARSKIVLNLHAYPQSPREDVRLSYLWANKAFVLSEGNGGVFEYAANQLPASCVEWVRRDVDRRFFAGAVHDSFVKQRQADYLRPLIAAEKAAA